MIAILRKELSDYFNSVRFIVLFLLVLLASAGGLYAAYQGIRAAISSSAATGTGFVFLRLFTSSGETLPPLIVFLGLFIPIIGIALGFDAINSERSVGTLSRILAGFIFIFC